jgi:hypothetical protein
LEYDSSKETTKLFKIVNEVCFDGTKTSDTNSGMLTGKKFFDVSSYVCMRSRLMALYPSTSQFDPLLLDSL